MKIRLTCGAHHAEIDFDPDDVRFSEERHEWIAKNAAPFFKLLFDQAGMVASLPDDLKHRIDKDPINTAHLRRLLESLPG